jgi:hypothetical protein
MTDDVVKIVVGSGVQLTKFVFQNSTLVYIEL